MRAAVLILAVVVACVAMTSAEPTFGLGAVALIPLKIAFKVAATAFKPFKFLGKRSVRDDSDTQEMVLASVAQLDPNGCLLKLLCHLQTKDVSELSYHEKNLAGMFHETSEAATPYSTAFVYAVGVGNKSQNPATCEKIFAKCPLEYVQLTAVLKEVHSCPTQE
ncbi:uncharacterized protein LOC127005208 isoform X2 [Eriocheir sinensis]|nr:uncharacterized protein LOC127005208 isoform X2 [Eriocheir sinensis]